MDLDRVRRGELIAGISAVALFIIMFLPWFGFDVSGVAEDVTGDVDANFNAWESFGFIDIVLFVTVIVAVAFAAASAMSQTVALPVAASAITAGLGILSTILIIYRLLDTPSDADRKYGVFLGLIAAAGIAYGGWLAMQEEGTSFGDEADRLQGRDTSAPPPST
ncbi:MAG TPA: hypothetical protein VK326_01545 [Solirubrobacterales bacterium]|nr:hypothetical protein [Solirubrobacterales bacterium]